MKNNSFYIKDLQWLEERIKVIEYLENLFTSEDFATISPKAGEIVLFENNEVKSLDYFVNSLSNIKNKLQELYSKNGSSYGLTMLDYVLIKEMEYLKVEINQYFNLKGNTLLQKAHLQTYTKQLDDIFSIIDTLTYEDLNNKLEEFLEKYSKSQINHFDKYLIDSKIIDIVLAAIEIQVSKEPTSKINLSIITKYGLDDELLHSIKSLILEKAKNKENNDKFTTLELYEKLNIDELTNPKIWNEIFEIHTIETVEVQQQTGKNENSVDTNEISFDDDKFPTLSEIQFASCLSSPEKLKSIFQFLKNSSTKCTIGKFCKNSNHTYSYKHCEIPNTFSSFKKLVKDCNVRYTYATVDETTGEYKDLSIEFANLEEFASITTKDYVRIIEIEINAKELFGCRFRTCPNLKSAIINGVENISREAFYMCFNLEHVYLGDSVKSIDISAFQNTSITEISIPDRTETIDTCAFYDCCNLKKAKLGNSIKIIGNSAFNHTALEEISIPNSTETIGDSAFCDCANLKKANLGHGVKAIGESAFYYTSLEEISIPDSTELIGNYAFSNCDKLRIVNFGNSVTTIGESAFSFTSLEEIFIPDSTGFLGNAVFYNCGNLRSVHLGNGITFIGNDCFYNTSLNEIYFPDSYFVSDDFLLQLFNKFSLPKKVYSNNCASYFDTVEIAKYTIDVPVEEKDKAATVLANDINNLIEDNQMAAQK